MTSISDPSIWSCPLPLRDSPAIVLGHGGGGRLTAELVEHLFLPAFRNPELERLGDAALLPAPGGRLAFCTDAFVVSPLFFPGGSIGDLAVHGTVNDLAMSGATPAYLTAAFILEEGLPLAVLGAIVDAMARAARGAAVRIVAGDTKVVERGHGHGCYITTAGIGVVPDGVDLGPHRVQLDDVILVSGTIGDHGVAIMSQREGLAFSTTIESDSAALGGLVAALLASGAAVHALRDPTRGGLAASLGEIAVAANAGMIIDERELPVRPEVQAACEILGLDPLYVANEGKLVAIVAPDSAAAALAALRSHPLGRDAVVIGRVTDRHPGMVAARTPIGATRVVPLPLGEQLPRIC
jgi:hydrogenase expression/formation protein HypE